MLDSGGRALALPEQGYRDFYGRERGADEFGSDFIASAQPEFAPVISNMLSGATDFQSAEVDGQEYYIGYTTMESTGWHVASPVVGRPEFWPRQQPCRQKIGRTFQFAGFRTHPACWFGFHSLGSDSQYFPSPIS